MADDFIEILSPVAAETTDISEPVPPVDSFRGKTVALLDNRHPGVAVVMERLRALLQEHTDVAGTVLRTKPSISRPCPPELMDELVERAQVVVTGVGT